VVQVKRLKTELFLREENRSIFIKEGVDKGEKATEKKWREKE